MESAGESGSVRAELPTCWQTPYQKAFFRALLWLAFGGYTTSGFPRIPREGPLLVIANHRSYLDPAVLAILVPRPLYIMAKHELFENPFFGALITKYGAFPVHREKTRGSTFRNALKILRAGGAIVVFPEGGIVEQLGQQGFKGGVGSLATMSGAPIMPIYIEGADTLFNWPYALSDSPSLNVHAGELIPPPAGRGREERNRITHLAAEALRRLELEHARPRSQDS